MECMEPIIKVTADFDYNQGHLPTSTENRYFHSVKQAKRWCEKQIGENIEWDNGGDLNPYIWWSPEIERKNGIATFYLEPVIIEVVNEDDGEI